MRGLLGAALAALAVAANAQPDGLPGDEALPPELLASVRASGLPASGFGFYAQAVDAGDAPPVLARWNAEQPFLMASTAKIVTSLAALDLLGSDHRWRTRAFATAAPVAGRLAGDLVIAGGGGAGLTPDELRRWFRQMHAEGLTQIRGRIVLDQLALLHPREPSQAPTTAAEAAPGGPPDPRTFTRGALVVSVRPGGGAKAAVALRPHPPGVVVLNDVAMGGGCSAYARWDRAAGGAAAPALRVTGRWDRACGGRDIAFVRVPAATRAARAPAPPAPAAIATPALVATLWVESGGTLRGRVVEAARREAAFDAPRAAPPWSSQVLTPLPEVLRAINKTSNNVAARTLLLALGGEGARASDDPFGGARRRVAAWLRSRGLAEDDIRIDQGSGQSRLERGKPRAMVQLLRAAWRTSGSRSFVDSLPIAGVDGTLAHRLRHGSATGQAFLKTGTLRDTRALAGYVRSRSGAVYAVAAVVNHPEAGRATPVLDAFIEWVAKGG